MSGSLVSELVSAMVKRCSWRWWLNTVLMHSQFRNTSENINRLLVETYLLPLKKCNKWKKNLQKETNGNCLKSGNDFYSFHLALKIVKISRNVELIDIGFFLLVLFTSCSVWSVKTESTDQKGGVISTTAELLIYSVKNHQLLGSVQTYKWCFWNEISSIICADKFVLCWYDDKNFHCRAEKKNVFFCFVFIATCR